MLEPSVLIHGPNLGDVTVFEMVLDDEDFPLSQLAQTLSPDEKVQAGGYLTHQLRARFIARRWLRRHVLSGLTGLAPQELEFAVSMRGKPSVSGGPHFSCSSSGPVAAVATCPSSPVGLDVQLISHASMTVSPLLDTFTPEEVASILEKPIGDRAQFCLQGWVKKEAVSKATGDGLAGPFNGIPVLGPAIARLEGVEVEDITLASESCAAVAKLK